MSRHRFTLLRNLLVDTIAIESHLRRNDMDKMKFESPDMTAQNIDRIAALFPNCVTEMPDENGKIKRAVNFELLKQMLSPDVADGDEAYEFTWVGKKAAIVEANKPIRKTIRPCVAESKDWDNTENLYIEGDNLEVLKLLQESYLGKVKMIYIDPPYNTGNDFIYADDFMRSQEEENEQMGMYDEDENRLFKNTDTNGRFHSDWCSMIYSRLMLARNLLTDDGVILISINEYETSNLSKICEEAFGRENFVCRFGWETKKAAQGMTTANMVVDNQESIYVYAKQIGMFKFRGLDRDETNGFSNPDKDPRGLWKRQYLQRLGQGLPVRTIVDPDTGNEFSFETPYAQDKLNRWIEEKRIIFPSDPTKYPARKEFLSEYENRQQLVTSLGLFATKSTTEKLYNIFDGIKIFSNPKPDTLMYFIIQQCAKSPDSIVLDFFSGSATTAHAVMQLNVEDGGHRKFIMVQLPEKCDEASEAYKAGYKNICEIGKERIRRAGDKIKSESPMTTQDLDIGFRVLKLDDTNMKDVYYAPDDYDQGMLVGLESNIKDDRTDLDLLFGCLIDWGLPLSLPYKSEQLGGCTVHTYNDGDLIACFDTNIPESVVKEIAQRKPLRAVFRDSGFASSPEKINVFEIFKLYMPEDANDISKRVRVI